MKIVLLATALITVTGCARVQIKHVSATDTSGGIHFCEPRPYLLVSKTLKKDDKGNSTEEFTSSILWFPDYSRRYVVKIKGGWGTVDGSVKLIDGWKLDSLGAKTDSKIPETIASITGLVKEAGALAKMNPNNNPEGLYRIDIAEDGSIKLVAQPGW
jgi:hypothetical protein